MAEILYKERSFAVVGAAIEVHRILGPGFLESVDQTALELELIARGIRFIAQQRLPLQYKEWNVGEYVADFLIDSRIILEIKSVSRLSEIHLAQAMHYLAATGCRLAILLHFGEKRLTQQRIVR